jgi:hypothetical protein
MHYFAEKELYLRSIIFYLLFFFKQRFSTNKLFRLIGVGLAPKSANRPTSIRKSESVGYRWEEIEIAPNRPTRIFNSVNMNALALASQLIAKLLKKIKKKITRDAARSSQAFPQINN